MNYLIDSANVKEVSEAMKLPFVNGVTTNTREVAYHAGKNLAAYLKEMRRVARGIVHIQVTTEETKEMVAEGAAIASIIKDVRIKIPVTIPGLKAMEQLTKNNIEVAATAVNTVTMAVLSAKAGAKSVIPYYGVMEDFEEKATDLLESIMNAFKKYEFNTELIFFARNVKQVKEGIRAGVTGCLMTLAGLRSLVDHPLSTREVAFMNSEWRRRFGKKTWVSLGRKK